MSQKDFVSLKQHDQRVPGDVFQREVRDLYIEQIAAAAHHSWLQSKVAKGQTSIKLAESESGEELMVPYSQLSEGAKEIDRERVRHILVGIGESGLRIIPAEWTAQPPDDEPREGPVVVHGGDNLMVVDD